MYSIVTWNSSKQCNMIYFIFRSIPESKEESEDDSKAVDDIVEDEDRQIWQEDDSWNIEMMGNVLVQ